MKTKISWIRKEIIDTPSHEKYIRWRFFYKNYCFGCNRSINHKRVRPIRLFTEFAEYYIQDYNYPGNYEEGIFLVEESIVLRKIRYQ